MTGVKKFNAFLQPRQVLKWIPILHHQFRFFWKIPFSKIIFEINRFEQAGADLGQAQVKLDDIVVIVVEVVVTAMVEVEVQLLFWVGGWSDKTKLILISNLVEVVFEVET